VGRFPLRERARSGPIPLSELVEDPELIDLDPDLAAVMLQSDPNSVVGRSCDLILQEGFEQFISKTDFVQALREQVLSRYSNLALFQSLCESCNEERFDIHDHYQGTAKIIFRTGFMKQSLVQTTPS
jgi:hypothetical protein